MSTSVSNYSPGAISIPDFKEHLLARRLSRLPKDKLVHGWEDLIDFSDAKSQSQVVKRIVLEYSIKKKNPEFLNRFKDFLRDSVLAAREADYLIHVENPQGVVDWIKSWKEGQFVGQNYNFSLHTTVELNSRKLQADSSKDLESIKKLLDLKEKYSNKHIENLDSGNENDIENNLSIEKAESLNKPQIEKAENIEFDSIKYLESTPFPSKAIFLVGSKHDAVSELNGLELVSYHPTTEFEIIIRENVNIVEVRGSFQVCRDFVATAIDDRDNPLSASRSYFIGETKDSGKSLVKSLRKIIKIDTLKLLLDGAFRKLSAKYPGSKASQFEVTLEDLKDLGDETDPQAQAIIRQMLENPMKGNISFVYGGVTYDFNITKTGGLFFRKYIPEEVVTYLIHKIRLVDSVTG